MTICCRLRSKDQAPLLLPPKDYDTVHRKEGKLIQYENRKCLNKEIVGKSGVYKISSDDSARGDSSEGGTGSDNHSSDDGLTMIIGQENKPITRNFNNNETTSPTDYPVVYASTPRVPFSPGPNTAELKKRSYFPSKEDLPGYLPGSRNSLNRQDSTSRNAPPSGKRFLRKQQSSPEFGLLPGYGGRQRSSYGDEGYTSLQRNGDVMSYHDAPRALGSRLSDIDLSQTAPLPPPSADVMRRSRDSLPRDDVGYMPAPDYGRGRRGAILKRTRSGYY